MKQILKHLLEFWVLQRLALFNSTAIITDLGTVKTSYDSGADSATYKARAISATGPIADVDGLLVACQIKAYEIRAILNYLAYGSQLGSGASGIFRTGDATAAQAYTLLVNIIADLA